MERAILDAALALLAEGGSEALTVEAVAARAGVARTTVYRRWRRADELLAAAVDDVVARLMPPARSGETRADLVAIVAATVRALTNAKYGRVVRVLLSELARSAEPVSQLRHRFVDARRNELREVLESGAARGELRAGIDTDTAADLLLGPVYYRVVLAGRPADAGFAETVVDAFLRVAREASS